MKQAAVVVDVDRKWPKQKALAVEFFRRGKWERVDYGGEKLPEIRERAVAEAKRTSMAVREQKTGKILWQRFDFELHQPKPAADPEVALYLCLWRGQWEREQVKGISQSERDRQILNKRGKAAVIREDDRIVWLSSCLGCAAIVDVLERIVAFTSAWMTFEVSWQPKTITAAVYSTQNRFLLGTVRWDTRWRRYVFSPKPGTIFEPTCLRDLAAFCDLYDEEHRVRLKVGRRAT